MDVHAVGHLNGTSPHGAGGQDQCQDMRQAGHQVAVGRELPYLVEGAPSIPSANTMDGCPGRGAGLWGSAAVKFGTDRVRTYQLAQDKHDFLRRKVLCTELRASCARNRSIAAKAVPAACFLCVRQIGSLKSQALRRGNLLC